MATPKALLCRLGKGTSPEPEEHALRSVGFAVGGVAWNELNAQPRGWMQLAPLLSEPGLTAWIMMGKAEDFTPDVVSGMTMLSLALKKPLLTACVVIDDGEVKFSQHLKGIRILRHAAWAAKVMALRTTRCVVEDAGFHIRAHLSPFTGQWLEIGPDAGEIWTGFMVGVTGAEVAAVGVGPRGRAPLRCVLHYPQMGILGELDGRPFHACAAQNVLDADTACYVRVDGFPHAVFVAGPPEGEERERRPLRVLECV